MWMSFSPLSALASSRISASVDSGAMPSYMPSCRGRVRTARSTAPSLLNVDCRFTAVICTTNGSDGLGDVDPALFEGTVSVRIADEAQGLTLGLIVGRKASGRGGLAPECDADQQHRKSNKQKQNQQEFHEMSPERQRACRLVNATGERLSVAPGV